METTIIGAGPTGMFLAIALARRGHEVTVVDRDPGPTSDTWWDRKGVMQFHHPHGFRPQTVAALSAEMPEVYDALLGLGAEPATMPGQQEGPFGLRSRRMTFERALRAATVREPGVRMLIGHADEIVVAEGRVEGVRVSDQVVVGCDLVIDASGRSGRLSDQYRQVGEGGDTGVSYVSRQYELLPGADWGPMNSPIGSVYTYDRYQAFVFAQDQRTFTALIIRATADKQLAEMRDQQAFERAASAIPTMATWVDPERSRPLTPVLPGGRLLNTYRGQFDADGRVAVHGLVFVGDAVCTTNPAAGRGVSTSLLQAQALLGLLDERGAAFSEVSYAFDEWCTDNIRPWFEDHVYWDADLARRWSGEDVDPTRPLPADLVMAAANEYDQSLLAVVGPYMGMMALPSTLCEVQPRIQEIYATGWRPAVPDGPSRDDLAEIVAAARSPEQT